MKTSMKGIGMVLFGPHVQPISIFGNKYQKVKNLDSLPKNHTML